MPLNCSHLNEGAVADLNEIFSERKIQTPEAERWWIPFTSLSFTRTNSPWILMLMLTSAEWLMRFTDANTPAVGSLCMRAGGRGSQKADALEQWFPTFLAYLCSTPAVYNQSCNDKSVENNIEKSQFFSESINHFSHFSSTNVEHSFLKVRICCFALSFMTVNGKSCGFGLLVWWKEQFEGITLSSSTLWQVFFCILDCFQLSIEGALADLNVF